MGYYDEQPPPHSHRAPSELEEQQPPIRRAPRTIASASATFQADFQHLCSGEPFKLLLAIENDNNALAAIRLTDELTALGAMPTVINVTRSLRPPLTSPSAKSYADTIFGESFHDNRCRLLDDLISNAVGERKEWPTESVIGDPAEKILAAAASEKAELIVMGINNHGVFAQAMGQNTATRIMGKASVPVLGVRPRMGNKLNSVMVATDFGASSRQAALVAANLIQPHGRLILVYVDAPPLADSSQHSALARDKQVADAFRRISEDIRANRSIDVETLHRIGDPTKELLGAAKLIAPDLIAIGSERTGEGTRIPLDSITRALILDGRWPMLVTPPPLEN